MNILLLEDSSSDIESCEASLGRFLAEHPEKRIELLKAQTIEQAKSFLDNPKSHIEGAIIDLKIGSDNLAGDEIIGYFIDELNLRTPVIIVTGTPDAVNDNRNYADVCKKGAVDYSEAFSLLVQIQETGLYNVMGENGTLEKLLTNIFQNNIVPNLKRWIDYSQRYTTDDVKRAFTRYVLSHVMRELDGDQDLFFPEECFLFQETSQYPRPGEFFERCTGNRKGEKWVVLTPPCDLAVRNNDDGSTSINVTGIQIALFEDMDNYSPKYSDPLTEKQRKNLREARKNPSRLYLYFLPTTDSLRGGFINFRTVTTVTLETLHSEYSSCNLVISPPFFKNILAKFSNYYSRQGQPELMSYE